MNDDRAKSTPASHVLVPGEVTEESGWVIERGDSEVSQPLYWGGKHGWTLDNLQAVRFARKEDAESVDIVVCLMRAVGKIPQTKNRIAEHGWGLMKLPFDDRQLKLCESAAKVEESFADCGEADAHLITEMPASCAGKGREMKLQVGVLYEADDGTFGLCTQSALDRDGDPLFGIAFALATARNTLEGK